jgi:hypothetical protein
MMARVIENSDIFFFFTFSVLPYFKWHQGTVCLGPETLQPVFAEMLSAGISGQQRMPTPPWHLMLPSRLS